VETRCSFCGQEIAPDDDGAGSFDGRRCCGPCGGEQQRRVAEKRFAPIALKHPRMELWGFKTFEYVAQDEAGRAALAAVKQWIESDPETDGWTFNVYLWGGVGAGKTGLAWSLLRHLLVDMDYRSGAFVNVRDLLADARAYYSNGGADPLDGLDRKDVLVLDDLGAERPTEWTRETIATLIERRYQNDLLTTIVTSNYSPSQLVRRLDPRDPVIGQRIVSRLVEDCTVIKVDGPDRRLEARRAA
jgi:DNA replication protein DnaC